MRAREYKFFQAAPTPRMHPHIGIALQRKVKTGTGAAKTGTEARPELEMGLTLELGLTLGIKQGLKQGLNMPLGLKLGRYCRH